MKMKNKNIFITFLLLIIILTFFLIKCDIKIFPDNIAPGDPIFNTSQVYGTTNERFYYSLGYYTEKDTEFYSKKYGIYYEPVKCNSDSLAYNDNSNIFVGQTNIIKKLDSTINKKANFFEEIELFRNTMTGKNIECPSNLKIIHDVNLKITYIIPVIASTSTKFTIHVKLDDTIKDKICDVQLEANKLKIVQIDIKTQIDNLLNQEVAMVFRCTDAIINTNIKLSGDKYLTFIFNYEITTPITLSNFRITVEDLFSKTGIKYNKELDRSKVGLTTDESCKTNSDCFKKHTCIGGFCRACHYSCAECNQDSSITITSCTKCGPLTEDHENSPSQTSGICPLNYIDLSQFRDITVNIMPKGNEYNDRATIGIWLFFSDLTNSRSLENDIYHIVLENRIVISLVPGDNVLTTYCHAYEDLYRKVTSDTFLHSSYTDKSSEYVVSKVIPDENQLNKMDIETMNGKWFHISCGISLWHKHLYLKSVVNGQMSYSQKKDLKKERLYPGSGLSEENIENDNYYNHIINQGEYLYLKLKNFRNSNAKIYARYLMLFKELIPINMQYMYFNFKDELNFKEILFQIPFDELIIDSNYQIKGYQYDQDGITSPVSRNIILELSHYETTDFNPALNFYRLLLNNPNYSYNQIDLKEPLDPPKTIERDLKDDDPSTENYQYLYDDNKILNCKDNYYYNHDTANNNIKCLNTCDNSIGKFITYPGISRTTGYCDYKCEDSFTCNQDQLSSTTADDYDYEKTNFCSNPSNAYNLFYNCIKKGLHKYYLQYSGFYNSQTIEIKLTNPLKSYIIEFWFYPDFFLRAKARETQYSYPTYTKNFFFHSNVIDCYFSQTDRLVPYIYDSYKIIKITKLFNSNEWNKFVIFGKYYSQTQDYSKTVFVNHAFDQPFEFDLSKENKATILESITFCENKCQDINSENIHWTTGYYRDLRIWDGDMASFSQIIQYNNFYPLEKFQIGVVSIKYYFPLSDEYITNNKLIDLQGNNVKITVGDFFLKKYNYGWKFDIIAAKGEKGYYSQHASDPAFIDSCDIGCARCWERSFCYECISGYFLSGRKCILIQKYYFRNPTGTDNDVTLEYDDNDAVTICFWTKPMGFADSVNYLMMTLGNNEKNLKLYYSAKENTPVYGLYLISGEKSIITDNVIGYQREFRDNIGKWTYISIAYHKEKSYNNKVYFPRMIKFEINTDSIEADPTKISQDPIFTKITIDKKYFGLFVGIKFYNEYIIQSIAYETSNQPYLLEPFLPPEPKISKYETSSLGLYCPSSIYENKLHEQYECVPDEGPDIGSFLETCDYYKDTLTTKNSCLNSCSGSGWERCNCRAKNHNSQMIYNNNNKNLCRPVDYINFSKIKINEIKVTNLISAKDKSQNKCTMQFWMFAYPYKPDVFKGITFKWNGHNKIKVVLDSGYNYNFNCTATEGANISIEKIISIKQWIFLSCAVDYRDNKKVYLNYNTQNDEVYLEEKDGVTGEITVDSKSNENYLTITDDTSNFYEEWGILFFRQIRLWNDAFFNAEFLSRILIETPSKFDNLLHSWEPTYKGLIVTPYEENLRDYDIVNSKNMDVKYQSDYQSTYGMNVINEEDYSILTMCSEDGLYFDVTLKKCLQFLDLSKMKDFTFKELPSAYSGSYAMAFWIFFDEAENYEESNILHFNWSRHLTISILKHPDLKGYCFPQGYYSNYINYDTNFDAKYNSTLNKAEVPLVDEGDSENGVWIWVICSVSYYNRTFFIQGNREEETKGTIIEEDLYTDSNGNVIKTSYPMRFYLSDLNNNVMYKSSLSIHNIYHERKLYLREILLFRNYIPKWYADRFKYMNMRMFTDNQLPSLLFVVNFADFNLDTKNLKYIYFERKYGSTIYERVDTSIYLSVNEVGSTFELSANFKFQPLCDLSSIEFKKYDITTGLCVDIKNCVLKELHATYCMEENMPLSCEAGYVFSFDNKDDDHGNVICTSQCKIDHMNEFLTPGTPKDKGICNTFCPTETISQTSDLQCPSTANLMDCGNENYRIGYKCIDKDKNDGSALFFSKCYNSPNFYRTISTTTLNEIKSGYFYEFWIKMDLTLINQYCAEAGTASKEYYLYSTPHSIYKDTTDNKYYYQIINSAYKRQITGIDDDKWNKIVIETIIAATGQNVKVHINFEKDIISINSISTSTSMTLQYISFCSRKESGDCIPGSSNIMWGSAFYKNIRVWDIRSSSIQTVQDYNNGIYSEIPKSLILYYPLSIRYMDNNVIKEIISGIDNINVIHQYSNNFQSDDNVINYNYELNLDQHLKHECIEPYIDPKDKKLLVKDECIKVTGYYLKVPYSTTVSFDIQAISTLPIEAFTFCIFMKFIGILKSSTSSQPIIFSFKDDTFIVYDISTSYLIFYIGGSQVEAFRDTNFHDYIGIWTPICIANFRSKNTYIHPHMITLNVNKIDLPFTTGFSIAKDGIQFQRISIGNEIIAYFSDFRIYSRFIQGNFGTIISQTSKADDLLINYPLTCSDDRTENCDVSATFTDPSMKPCCVGDYNIYENSTLFCTNDNLYFDINLPNDKTCDDCYVENCKTLCYNSKDSECTCDMRETVYWLRKNKASSKTYCEHPPYIDYSLLNDVSIRVPSSSTNESTIEFWFFIYSYNTTNVNFKEINIVWDLHNRVQIINEKNSLFARCYALWDSSDTTKFTDLVKSISVTAFGWTSIRCGSNINLPTYKHFFNTLEDPISVRTEIIPYYRSESPTNLLIYNNPLSPQSYGFLFIRELKLWQQYNRYYIDTSYINLNLENILLYNREKRKSEGYYPGLISLIRSDYSIEEYSDAINGIYHTKNLIINEDDSAYYDIDITLTRNDQNYIGYNLIDPTNADYYKKLVLCEEGWVYNSLFDYCEQPSYTKCYYPGDTKDTCIRCPDDSIYIHPVDGLCKDKCPTGYYKRDDMNQCRPCEETCYKCNWMFEFNCTECIGERYLVRDEGRCVLKCEDYNLTASNITDNLCTGFDADAILINYVEYEPIDINTFEKLVAKVINYTSKDYTVLWGFNEEKTREENHNDPMYYPESGPFIGDLTHEEEVKVNKSFFQLGKEYIVSLTVIAHNVLYYDAIVNTTIEFHLTMNKFPFDGILTIFPTTGLYKTTFFVIKCENWTDDTSEKEKLQYEFYAKEVGAGPQYLLRGWSLENEISTNFSVINYQQDKIIVTITCFIRDELNATANITNNITIATALNGGYYSLSEALMNYSLPTDEEKSKIEYDVLLYHRSQYLLSLSIDAYKTVYPSFLQTQFESALDGTEVLMEDPTCITEYCNGNGKCGLVDEFIICHCNEGWTGRYCHIDKNGQDKLQEYMNQLFGIIKSSLEDSISWYQFMGLYNLFKGASLFFNDIEFFSNYIEEYFSYAMTALSSSIANNTYEYLEILDFYYSFEMMRMEKLKQDIQYEKNNFERNISLSATQMAEFKKAFEYLNSELLVFMRFLANQNAVTRRSITFISENYYLAVVPVNPSFNDKKFFQDRKAIYKPHVDFMTCLNYIEMDKLANPYYQGYFLYIDYNFFPFGYNYTLLVNNSSPLIEMRFVDSTTGKYISVTGCQGSNQLIIHMPFTSYKFLEEFNFQKLFYDPNIYKSPDDPIFSDPVYIEENGIVSDDTIEQRIEKYSRRYNISTTYYDELFETFSLEGITYINFTNDLNFIEFGSTHLCRFTTFMIPNNATYHPNGRFYYLGRPRILKWFPNYYQSFGSLIFLACLIFYFIYMIICLCYDSQYTDQEGLLEYIKREIVKNFFPYAKNKDEILEKLIPTQMNLDFKPEMKFGPEARIPPAERIGSTLNNDKLTLKKNRITTGDDDEEEKNTHYEKATTKRELDKKKQKRKMNNFLKEKPPILKKKAEEKAKDNEDDFASEIDREIGKVNRATFTIKHLPKDFEKSKEEKERRIENYAHLKLTSRHYFNANYKLRTTLINSFCNVSLFQPRWKKLTMLVTEIGLMILVISIILTMDASAKLSNGLIKIGYLFAYGLAASTFSNLMMYFIAIFFHFPQELANRLYKFVLFNGQLIVLREWDTIVFNQGIKSIPGVFICVIFWAASLYVGLGFTAVW